MIGVTSSHHLSKHILVVVLCSFTLYSGVNSLSCSDKNSDDNNRCDKIIPGGRRCYLLTQNLFGCGKGQRFCKVNRTFCFPYRSICTPQCCEGWKEDSEHRCTVNLRATVVGLLFIVLAIMAFAMFRVCKARRNLRGRLQRNIRGSATNMQNYNSSIFTVYNNEPPPYDVVENSKLPEYTLHDNPPSYEDNDQATGDSQLPVSISEQSQHDTTDDKTDDVKHSIKVTAPTIVILVVVAVMLVILIVLVALIKLGKAGQYLTRSRSPHVRQRSIQRTQENATVFTVYNNEPPPYDVVVNSNLPEYSPRDIPPLYKEKEDTQR
ncbi:unnamed protein product [Mytilus edulis]|uniref:Uncharacterized protein n=1 Tax=Mytilus edulis TaxID=6550 RepID=A0A8S3VJT7_MYTED|nr:unnamed protein product [Mytilus edulis]